MPYFLLASVLLSVVRPGHRSVFESIPELLTVYATALPLVAVSGVFALVRPMSAGAVRAMCGVPGELLADGPARSRPARLRTAVWWTVHLGLGAVISGMSLAVPPMVLVLLGTPFLPALRDPELALWGWFRTMPGMLTAPLAGLALLAALAGCAAAAGALLASLAPVLLGPTPADRLAAAEERAADLAVRNRLARELHDSVGHALSAVTLQASAARRVLDSDPAFVREALAAIEDTTRRTVGELDAVLGLLRDGDETAGSTAPAPTLAADLEGLLARTRAGGVEVVDRQDPGRAADWERLPAIASREAYRIVQEGLSNALKHGTGPVRLSIAVRDESELEITMTNPCAGSGQGQGGEAVALGAVALGSGADRSAGTAGTVGSAGSAGTAGSGRSGGTAGAAGSGGGAVGARAVGVQGLGVQGLGAQVPGAQALGVRSGRGRGGRGLTGIAERAALLGGRAEAGAADGTWRLRAVLPLAGPAGESR
ncbi:sensor histidine kinase [Streptomyces sp. NRRL S-87]|uniref:sensor histidine kinase n=1 Tax=Streptomyces sp. NRRL S-87 TaxID=1463920 RepID=UPI00099BD5D0|nr:histidine kinase [Streptomyces sp. NRRL S-87]